MREHERGKRTKEIKHKKWKNTKMFNWGKTVADIPSKYLMYHDFNIADIKFKSKYLLLVLCTRIFIFQITFGRN